jgi:hypothetical protein
MDQIIQELKFQASDLVNQEEVADLGEMLGVQQFVTFHVRPVQGIYQVTARMINVEKGKVEKIAVKRCEDRYDYLQALLNEIAWDLAALQDKKGTLKIESEPADAEILMFGIREGYAPLSIRLAPGPYLITVKKTGYQEKKRTLYVSPEKETSWTARLSKKSDVRLRDYIGGKSHWNQ